MAMRVVTPAGADFLRGVDHALNEGLITVRQWERQVISIYIRNQVETTDEVRCVWHWSSGCSPAKWGYLDDYRSTAEEGDQCYGYLCEGCAETEMKSCSPINLTPLSGGVYAPDVERVINANWNMYCEMRAAKVYAQH